MVAKKLFLNTLTIVLLLTSAFPSLVSAKGSQLNSPLEVKYATSNILIGGLVGGVLGLSTLSFYAQPQDNIRNIFFGAGAGVILTAIYLTYAVSQSPLPVGTNTQPHDGVIVPYADFYGAGLLFAKSF